MDRDELIARLTKHQGFGTWCDGCSKRVTSIIAHQAEVLMPQGVDYLLEARELD